MKSFFSKKNDSLANEIKRVITLRILFTLGILFLAILVLAVVNVSSSFSQTKKSVEAQCFILSEFTISQALIDNESAIQLNLDSINSDNKYIHFDWIKDKKSPPADQVSWKFPFSWTDYCPITSTEGENFGYFKVSGSILYDNSIVSSSIMRVGLIFSFGFIIFLLLYPLGNKIPDRLFIKPVMDLLNLLNTGWKEENKPEKREESELNTNRDNQVPVEILEIKSKVIQMLKEAEIHSHEMAFGQIAAKVAHDIRSPLAALNILLKKNAASLPESELNIIQNATQRINDIANNLLTQKRVNKLTSEPSTADPSNENIACKPELIPLLLENIILEKRAQYSDLAVQFELNIAKSQLETIFVNLVADEFNRALSNLINNAVEAITGKGKVTLELSKQSDNFMCLSIVDTGKGMHSEQLEKVLMNGISVGKENGSGIGLSSAIQSIESWGGVFSMTSEFGKGTSVELKLPMTKTPKFYQKNPDLIFIDDSVYLTDAWKAQATLNGKKMSVFNTVNELRHYIHYFSKETPLYIDSNLGTAIKGEILAKELYEMGFTTIYLCTGMDDCEFSDMPWIKKIIGKEYPINL